MGSFDHGNEPLGSIQGWEFPDQIRDYQLLTSHNAVTLLLISRRTP